MMVERNKERATGSGIKQHEYPLAHIERPATTSLFGYLPETWWHQPPAR